MKLCVSFIGMFSFLALSIEAIAIQCPNIPQVQAATHCQQTGAQRYVCSIRTNNNRWIGQFVSVADVTTQPGTHELVGRQGANTCNYKFITPTLEVDYQIFHKQENEHSQNINQQRRNLLKK